MTDVSAAGASVLEPPCPDLRIQILRLADCLLVEGVRKDLQECLDHYGVDPLIEEVEGPYPSPTLLVCGRDVTECLPAVGPACRLDLPSREQISRAIEAALAFTGDQAIHRAAATEVGHDRSDNTSRRRQGVAMCVTEQQSQRSQGEMCGARALCGWSPPSLPADTATKRRVDRIRVGNLAAIGVIAVVVGLLNLAPHLPARASLATVGVAGLAAGGWCSLNFWRCRHAHCLITGPGWLAFGVFAFSEAAVGHSLIDGYEQPVFMAVLGTAVAFEIVWHFLRHTNAVAPR